VWRRHLLVQAGQKKGVPVTSGQSETLANLGMDPVHLSSHDPLAQLSWDPMADELSWSAVYEPVASNAARAMFFAEPVPSAFDLIAEPGAGIRWDPMSLEVGSLIGCCHTAPCRRDDLPVSGTPPARMAHGSSLANPPSI
jgi:hypothetical protein